MLIRANDDGLFELPPSPGRTDFQELAEDTVQDIIGDLQGRFGEWEVGPARAYFEFPNGDGSYRNIVYKTLAYKITPECTVEDFKNLHRDLTSIVVAMAGDFPSKHRLVWRLDTKVVCNFDLYEGWEFRTRFAVVPLREES